MVQLIRSGKEYSDGTGIRTSKTLRVTVATDDLVPVSAASLPLPTGAATETTLGSVKTAVETIDNFISGSRGLVTEDNSAAIKTAVETIDNAISGTEMQVDIVSSVPITVTKSWNTLADWTLVAQNTIAKSSVFDFSTKSEGILYIQAALATVTAHTGTRFIVQIAPTTFGNENWQTLTEFVALIGTAVTDLIENNPLAAGSTSITLTAHTFTVLGMWLFIEDGTLINSELVFESAQNANAITIIDETTNAHVVNTAIFNVAMTQNVSIPKGVYQLRVVVDNTYDADGSTLYFKASIGSVA